MRLSDENKNRRRSIRWQGWDYGTPGYYFVTICTYQRLPLFDDDQLKQVVEYTWQQLPRYPKSQHITLDDWVVMPNHLHGLIVIRERVNPDEKVSRDDEPLFRNARPGQLGRLIATYKAVATKRINRIRGKVGGRVWQRGYWDRVVRNERELQAIRHYIRENPRRWSEDRDNLESLVQKMNRYR